MEERLNGEFSRRTAVASIGTGVLGAVAGCVGGGNGNGDSDGNGEAQSGGDGAGSSPTDADDSTPVSAVTGDSDVDGLTVTMAQEGDSEDEFRIESTDGNTGEQTTYPLRYGYLNSDEIAPGETATAELIQPVDGSVSAVTGARATVTCSDPARGDPGVYCN